MKKGLTIKTNAIIQTIDMHTGEVKKETKVHNIVTNAGLDEVAHLIGGISTPTAFQYMAIGTDATAPGASQTALGTEVSRENVTPTDEGVGIIEYDNTFTFGSGESYTVIEYGLFNDATTGIMLNRLTDAGHDVDIDNGLRVRITITCANA